MAKIEDTKPQLFEYEGFGKYDQNVIKNALLKNREAYLDHLGYKGDYRQAVSDQITNIATNIGSFKRDIGGGYVTPEGFSSTGKYDRKLLGLGNKKNDLNNVQGDALGLLSSILEKAPQYTEPKIEKKSFDFNKELSQDYFGGKDFNAEDWYKFDFDAKNNKYNTINRTSKAANTLERVLKNVESYDWGETPIETIKGRLNDAIRSLSDKEFGTKDFESGTALGISNFDKYFSTLKKTEEAPIKTEQPLDDTTVVPGTNYTPSQIKKFIDDTELGASSLNTSNLGIIKGEATSVGGFAKSYSNILNNAKKISNINASRGDKPLVNTSMGLYDMDAAKRTQMLQNTLVTNGPDRNIHKIDDTEYAQLISAAKHMQAHKDKVDSYGNSYGGQISGNYVYFPESIDGKRHTILRINTTSNRVERLPISNTPYWETYQKNYVDNAYNTFVGGNPNVSVPNSIRNDLSARFQAAMNSAVASQKNGGVLKYQLGGDIISNYNKQIENSRAGRISYDDYLKEQNQELEQRAVQKKLSPEVQKRMERKPTETKFTAQDYARLGAAAMDVSAIGAAFVPGAGTLTAGGLGLASTVTNLIADASEGNVNWGSTAANLGLDVMGMIPGVGGGSKAAKVAKTLVHYVPTLIGLASTLSNAGEITSSLSKLTKDPSSLDVNDWRNISTALGLVTGATVAASGKIKNNNWKKNNKTTDVAIKTNSGKDVILSKEEYSQLSKLNTADERNNFLKSLKYKETVGGAIDTKFNWKSPINKIKNWNDNTIKANPVYSQGPKVTTSNFLGTSFQQPKVNKLGNRKIAKRYPDYEKPNISIQGTNKYVKPIINTKDVVKGNKEYMKPITEVNYRKSLPGGITLPGGGLMQVGYKKYQQGGLLEPYKYNPINWNSLIPKKVIPQVNPFSLEAPKQTNYQGTFYTNKMNEPYLDLKYTAKPMSNNSLSFGTIQQPKSNLNINVGEGLSLLRYLRGKKTNQNIYNEAVSHTKPVMISAAETTPRITGDLFSQQAYENQGANILRQGRDNTSSNYDTYSQNLLNSGLAAASLNLQGSAANKQALVESQRAYDATMDANAQRRVAAANSNIEQMRNTEALKSRYKQLQYSTDYSNEAQLLASIEDKYSTNKAKEDALRSQINQKQLYAKSSSTIKPLQDEAEVIFNQYNNETDAYKKAALLDKYKAKNKEIEAETQKYLMGSLNSGLEDSKYSWLLANKKKTNNEFSPVMKNGGSIDNKLNDIISKSLKICK